MAETDAGLCEPIQIGRLNNCMAVDAERVVTPIVGIQHEYIERFFDSSYAEASAGYKQYYIFVESLDVFHVDLFH